MQYGLSIPEWDMNLFPITEKFENAYICIIKQCLIYKRLMLFPLIGKFWYESNVSSELLTMDKE